MKMSRPAGGQSAVALLVKVGPQTPAVAAKEVPRIKLSAHEVRKEGRKEIF